jgi:hypothetical protein
MSRAILLGMMLAPVGLSGCLSQVSPREGSESLKIHWESDFESACRTAQALRRPILVVMAAGGLREKC